MKPKSAKYVPSEFEISVGRALRRAARVARKTAILHGTPIYVSANGKVVALDPRTMQRIVRTRGKKAPGS